MKYQSAMTPSTQTPCTNAPLNCPMCPQSETFWKYRFIDHITERHLTESLDLPSLDIPLDLWATTHISKWEEFRMGIPVLKTEAWRVSNEFPDSDVVQVIQEEMVDSGEEGDIMIDHDVEREAVGGRSRKRAMSTVSTLSRQGSPTKKAHHRL